MLLSLRTNLLCLIISTSLGVRFIFRFKSSSFKFLIIDINKLNIAADPNEIIKPSTAETFVVLLNVMYKKHNTNNNTKSLIIFFINTPPNIKISIHINFSLRLIHSLYSV